MTVWASDSLWMFLGVVLAFHLGRVWQFYKDERRGQDRTLREMFQGRRGSYISETSDTDPREESRR